jgi:hypothetical protein
MTYNKWIFLTFITNYLAAFITEDHIYKKKQGGGLLSTFLMVLQKKNLRTLQNVLCVVSYFKIFHKVKHFLLQTWMLLM